MAQEMNESVAYLMALRQTAGHQGEAEAPKGPENHLGDNASLPTSEAGERFQGADKRRAPRYKCEGSAQVREEGCDVHTWVTFIDVSIHGCYVEAQATYPADTVLHMKLEANGFRVETKGRVRVSYPYLGMGIAFEDISEENMSQLKRMLATLSRPAIIMGPASLRRCRPPARSRPYRSSPIRKPPSGRLPNSSRATRS